MNLPNPEKFSLTLFQATLLLALLLLGCGALLLWKANALRDPAKRLLRSSTSSVILFGVGSLWFLLHVYHLGEADFGNHRHLLLTFFGAIALLSCFFLPDFLAVRGGAIVTLLAAGLLLDAAYMDWERPARLFMVSLVFAGIVAALYFGTVPYKLRDFFEWLFANPRRPRAFGSAFAAYGLILLAVAFTY